MGSPALTAGAQVMSGYAASAQQKTEAMLARSQAKDTDLQALELSERRREELRAASATYAASRAARGLSADSPTGMAVEKELRRQEVRDEGAERYGLVARSSALRLKSRMLKKAASMSVMGGYLAGADTIGEAVGQVLGAGG